jgi:4-amino-4-deoxy-L-arabinose transferase-like glycosyltransferase
MQSTPIFSRKSLFILVTLLVVVVIIQAQNLFRFPYYQDAEGTNIANAWSLQNTGELTPYTYAYDEPPAGSFVLTIWTILTGGVSAFGFSVNSGRVLMLVLHLITTGILYGIAKKTSKSDLAALVAALVFAFSPLVVGLQRRVLLDNIMLVWFLLSIYLMVGENRTLGHYIASAAAFALAVLTKGGVIGFLPVLVYIILSRADKHHRRFAAWQWATVAGLLIFLYPLYAQMRLELFPEGTLLGGSFPHVSLLEALADRGPQTGAFLNLFSGLSQSFNLWVDISNVTADPVLVYGGLISALFVFILALDNKNARAVLAMNLGYLLYLVAAGTVFSSDVLIFLPILALNVGMVFGALAHTIIGSRGSVWKYGFVSLVSLLLLYPFGMFYGNRLELYTQDQVSGQIDAVSWVEEHIADDAVVVTDNYAFVELRQTMPNAHHYWKVDTDPAVTFTILEGNWCNIDYLITTPQVLADIETYHLEMLREAFNNSELLMAYPNDGWPVEVRQVRKLYCTTENEVASDGADADPVGKAATRAQ